jgi:hypothetical protein
LSKKVFLLPPSECEHLRRIIINVVERIKKKKKKERKEKDCDGNNWAVTQVRGTAADSGAQ